MQYVRSAPRAVLGAMPTRLVGVSLSTRENLFLRQGRQAGNQLLDFHFSREITFGSSLSPLSQTTKDRHPNPQWTVALRVPRGVLMVGWSSNSEGGSEHGRAR